MLVVVCVVSIIRFGGGRIMNLWLKPDWDRGYEAGRQAALEELGKAKPASLQNLAFDTGVVAERTRIIKLLEQETDIIYEFAYAIELIKGENNAD
jgi:hypothetical protein